MHWGCKLILQGSEWVRHDTLEVLASFQRRHNREINRMITVADNGGENGGTQVNKLTISLFLSNEWLGENSLITF